MATSKVSHLLIIDLKRFISVFIREIYTFNVKQKHRINTVGMTLLMSQGNSK